MNLEEQLHNARLKLGRLEESRTNNLQTYGEEIKQKEQRQERQDTLNTFKDWVSRYETSSAKDIEDLKSIIADLEKQIATPEYQQEKRARAAIEAMKETARAAWMQEGGNPDEFENAWPEIERDILKKRTIAAMEKAAKP